MEPRIQYAQTEDGVSIRKLTTVVRGGRLGGLGTITALLAAVLSLALLAAACGGEADDGVGEGGFQELKALADSATEGATAKVTYTVTTAIDDDVTESEQVVAQRPPDSRMEMSVAADGEGSRSVVINRGDTMYVCLARGSDASCLDFQPSTDSAQEALAQAYLHVPVEDPSNIELFDKPQQLVESARDIPLLDTSQRRIAGLDATCFMEETANAETELCFSGGGLTLYWRYSEVSPDGTTRVFEATAVSVSTDLTDADFEPPFEIVEGSRFETPEP